MSESWLNNPWIIAIVGGVLSGLLVFVVSRFVLSRREDREYVQKVLAANREILYAIRPGISEAVLPSREVVESMLSATARKYVVDRSDLWDPPEVAQELIKEVMDSSFLSAHDKANYCESLAEMGQRPASTTPGKALDETRQEVRSTELAAYRTRMTRLASIMMAMLTGLMTALIPLLGFTSDPSSRDKLTVLLPGLLSVLVIISSVGMAFLLREMRQRERERRERKEGPSSNSERSAGAE